MLKKFFSSIFSKEAYQAPQKAPTFAIKDRGPVNDDFELAEMNFVEFAKLAQKDFAEIAQKKHKETAGVSQSK